MQVPAQQFQPNIVSPPPIVDSAGTRIEYEAHLADEAVRLPKLLVNRRFWELLLSIFGYMLTSSLSMLFPEQKLTEAQRQHAKAQAFKELLFDLGPTFIKLGQFLSVRRDILPLELAEELALLQDKVPPFAPDMVRQTIRIDLGAEPEQLFLQFEETPIAAASIGQVHRVQLKDGSWAVIKVQRPELAEAFYQDLGLMRVLAKWWLTISRWMHNFGVKTASIKSSFSQKPIARQRPLDVATWMELSDEFGRTLFSEIDYLKEGRNADRLRKLVRPKPNIRVPRVHWKYTGRHVLTLEYIPGTKISQVNELRAKGFDLREVGNMLVNCYLEQFVLTGFFHADPHAGNLAIDDDGRLIIYDFGMMGEISEDKRRALLCCVMAVVRKDPEQVTKSLTELGIVSRNATADAVSRAITPFIDYYAGRDIMNLDFQNLENDIDQVIAERSFRLPADLAYLLRAGSSLEGIARTLKPDFSFVAAVRPVMTKWAIQQGIESLAKNGRLLEFAEFAINELKASRHSNPTQGESKPNGHATGNKSTGFLRQKTDGKRIAKIPDDQFIISKLSATPAKCNQCAHYKSDKERLENRLVLVRWIGLGYFAISIFAAVVLSFLSSPDYRQLSLYFVIGSSILGAIIIWQFTNLLKWSQPSSDDGKRRGNGD